jgi:hypothetical protein
MVKADDTRARTADETPLAPLIDMQKAGLGNMVGANAAMLESMGAMGAEVMEFLAERLREDVQTQRDFMQCRDVGEMQKLQAEFVRKAVDQYQAETGKLIQMSMAMLKST